VNKSRFLQLLASGVAAGTFARPSAARANDVTIRVATIPSDTGAEPLYGLDSGTFAQNGLHIELSLFTNYGAVQGALGGGAVDIAVNDTLGMAVAVEHGAPFQIIAPGARYVAKAPTLMMCVGANSTIRQASDLAGQTIALPTLRNSPEASVRLWLAQQHVDAANIKLVEVPLPQMGVALERGTVAAATITEPSLTAARLAGAREFANVYGAVAPEFFQNVWTTTVSYAQANPDVIKRVVAAIYKTAAWANTHHPESGAILAKYTKVSAATTQAMTRTIYGTDLNRKFLQPLLDAGRTTGLLTASIGASELIAPRLR
jgi:NitT/TauT family transport system substrate-binding protein